MWGSNYENIESLKNLQDSQVINNHFIKILEKIRINSDVENYFASLKYLVEKYYDSINIRLYFNLQHFCKYDNFVEIVEYLILMFPNINIWKYIFYSTSGIKIKELIYNLIGVDVFNNFKFNNIPHDDPELFNYYCDLGLLQIISPRELLIQLNDGFPFYSEICKILLDYDSTILSSTICSGMFCNKKFVKYLIDNYIDVISLDNIYILLNYLFTNDNLDCIKYLLDHDVIYSMNIDKIFINACEKSSNVEIIKYMLEKFPDINVGHDNLAISAAIQYGNCHIVKYILDNYYIYKF